MYEFHLFAGIGGGILGGMLAGHTPVGAVELAEYPRKVLVKRQMDGMWKRDRKDRLSAHGNSDDVTEKLFVHERFANTVYYGELFPEVKE